MPEQSGLQNVGYAPVLALLLREIQEAERVYEPMSSPHEGISIIREEYEEAWDLVKQKYVPASELCGELIQTAAMCCRMVKDLKLANSNRIITTGQRRPRVEPYAPVPQLTAE